MKSALLALVMLASSVGYTCGQQEAQFIGKIKNYSVIQFGSLKTCLFEIQYTMYNVSGVCPLDEGEVAGIKFSDETCKLQNGQQVSGILVKKDGNVYIE